MARRLSVLRTSALVALVFAYTLCASMVCHAQNPIVLEYANTPPASTFPCIQMERWAAEVTRRTGGRVVIRTHPASTLLNFSTLYEGVVSGRADIGCLHLSSRPGDFPLSELFELPVGFPNAKVASVTFLDFLLRHRPDEFSAVKILTAFTSGPSCIMSKVPIGRMSDLPGLEIRAVGKGVGVLDALGAVPVALPMSQTRDALHDGMVKGVLSSPEVLMDMNFAEYCKFVSTERFQVHPFVVIMNSESWDGLPKDVKRVMDGLSREHALWTGAYADDQARRALQWSLERHGIQMTSLAVSDANRMREVMENLVESTCVTSEEHGVPSRAVLEEIRTAISKSKTSDR
ncbi:TRAP-type C4-dicarboxylate transport system substrate-binding protein [Desulfobaculum xiamenense]|uniref:TRAP-type C4-dicarboxylate transport system substrate-binding protein n=1 Tax=Desulfobaculum xiamenense TaxID=995050 RepID=A0A846QIF9_9BACT|nr:TRAP transporter substrate-binding protein DctP [Desulfobaculum xiamenense]NJB68018.1 TRAP-type C4-dicarboxylate transport system substrate-binding protein [Desulfobaculum xiamenense]